MKTSEILDMSADAIQRLGWGQGTATWYPDRGAGLCLEGGIAAAMDTDMRRINGNADAIHEFTACPAYAAVSEYLQEDLDALRRASSSVRLYNWNDYPGRTSEEVIGVLRAAAMVEHAKEEALVAEPISA